ncbi:hypothetical protein M407DRAFT_52303, partial [Tulasnella calospora MUT 4182]
DEESYDDFEEPTIKINVQNDGTLVEATQIDDYWWRGESLKDMCFYDFVRFVSKVKCGARPPMQRLGTYQRHKLTTPHPQWKTHELVQHTDEALLNVKHEYVPR